MNSDMEPWDGQRRSKEFDHYLFVALDWCLTKLSRRPAPGFLLYFFKHSPQGVRYRVGLGFMVGALGFVGVALEQLYHNFEGWNLSAPITVIFLNLISTLAFIGVGEGVLLFLGERKSYLSMARLRTAIGLSEGRVPVLVVPRFPDDDLVNQIEALEAAPESGLQISLDERADLLAWSATYKKRPSELRLDALTSSSMANWPMMSSGVKRICFADHYASIGDIRAVSKLIASIERLVLDVPLIMPDVDVLREGRAPGRVLFSIGLFSNHVTVQAINAGPLCTVIQVVKSPSDDRYGICRARCRDGKASFVFGAMLYSDAAGAQTGNHDYGLVARISNNGESESSSTIIIAGMTEKGTVAIADHVARHLELFCNGIVVAGAGKLDTSSGSFAALFRVDVGSQEQNPVCVFGANVDLVPMAFEAAE